MSLDHASARAPIAPALPGRVPRPPGRLPRQVAELVQPLLPVLVTLPLALVCAALIVFAGPLVSLLLVVGFAAVAVALVRPVAGVALAIALIPLELFSLPLGASAGITPSEALFVVAGLGWAGRRALAGRLPAVPSPLTAPLALLIVAIIPGFVVAIEPFLVGKTLVMWASFACVFWLIVADGRRETVRLLLLALALAGTIVGLIAIIAGGDQRLIAGGSIATGRALGSFESPNTLASFLALALPAALALGLRGQPAIRPLALAGAGVIGTGLALSLSRGGLLAAIGALVLLLLWGPVRKLAICAGVVLLVLTFNGAAIIAETGPAERVVQRLSSVSSAQRVDPRLDLWPSLPGVIADHPLVGIGANQFPLVAERYGLRDRLLDAPFPHAHNLPLNFWVELGTLGLIAFIWFAAALVRVLVRACRREDERERALGFAIAAALFAFALHGFVDVILRANPIAALVLVLAACGTVIAQRARTGPARQRAAASSR